MPVHTACDNGKIDFAAINNINALLRLLEILLTVTGVWLMDQAFPPDRRNAYVLTLKYLLLVCVLKDTIILIQNFIVMKWLGMKQSIYCGHIYDRGIVFISLLQLVLGTLFVFEIMLVLRFKWGRAFSRLFCHTKRKKVYRFGLPILAVLQMFLVYHLFEPDDMCTVQRDVFCQSTGYESDALQAFTILALLYALLAIFCCFVVFRTLSSTTTLNKYSAMKKSIAKLASVTVTNLLCDLVTFLDGFESIPEEPLHTILGKLREFRPLLLLVNIYFVIPKFREQVHRHIPCSRWRIENNGVNARAESLGSLNGDLDEEEEEEEEEGLEVGQYSSTNYMSLK